MSVLNLQKMREKKKKGPNDHIGEPIDAPVGHHPRVVKVPMHDKADVNPKFHEAKEKEKTDKTPDVKKGAGWNAKDERMYNHIKDSGASERIAAATVNKQRRKDGRTKMKPDVSKGDVGIRHYTGEPTKLNTPEERLKRAKIPKLNPKPILKKGGPGSGPRKGKPPIPGQDQHGHPWSVAWQSGGHLAEGAHESHNISHGKYTVTPKTFGQGVHLSYDSKEGAHEHLGRHPSYEAAAVAASTHHRNVVSGRTKKSLIGENMPKNEVSDLFKAELGKDASSPITNCIHCKHALTHADLQKGLGPQFVADDNDNPHSGGDGQVEPSRPGSGVPEHDQIAPLLKSCKGPEAGDQEEYPISKSEMVAMGMEVDEMEDGWYTISKSEVVRVGAKEHIGFLAGRKNLIAKGYESGVDSIKPKTPKAGPTTPYQSGVDSIKPRKTPNQSGSVKKGEEDTSWHPSEIAKSNQRAGGVHGPSGEPLVIWDPGSDQAVADYIEKSGHYGIGNDEPIRTQGNGGE